MLFAVGVSVVVDDPPPPQAVIIRPVDISAESSLIFMIFLTINFYFRGAQFNLCRELMIEKFRELGK